MVMEDLESPQRYGRDALLGQRLRRRALDEDDLDRLDRSAVAR